MTVTRTFSDSTNTTIYIAIPEGPRIRRRVKEVVGTAVDPEGTHPGKPHPWREMLHFGQRGTGFAQCLCGAIGVPYGRSSWPRRSGSSTREET